MWGPEVVSEENLQTRSGGLEGPLAYSLEPSPGQEQIVQRACPGSELAQHQAVQPLTSRA